MSYLIWTIAIDRALILLGLSNFLNKTNSTSSNSIGYFKCLYAHAPPPVRVIYKVLYRKALPQGPTPYPFVYQLDRKCIPCFQGSYPFCMYYISKENCIPFLDP